MISEETKKKIEQVASVCIRCRKCMKECIMLNRFAQNPKALFTQYLELGPENMDKSIAYSCNECSQCTLKCPKGLNLKAVFQSLKEDYAAENQGIVPVTALLPSEQGQVKECSPEYCTILQGSRTENKSCHAKYLFIPGKFPAQPILAHLALSLGQNNVISLSSPVLDEISQETISLIQNHESQILITACPSSYKSLREAFPHRRILFYWDLMQDIIGLPETSAPEDARIQLHSEDSLDGSIRWVLDKLGCQWEERTAHMDLLSADQDCRQILGLLFGLK